MDSVLITKDEALAALRAAAFIPQVETCGHTGCTDHRGPGEPLTHCFLGASGADWSLADAERVIAGADKVGWADHLMGHDLVARVGEKTYWFDVRWPVSSGVR